MPFQLGLYKFFTLIRQMADGYEPRLLEPQLTLFVMSTTIYAIVTSVAVAGGGDEIR